MGCCRRMFERDISGMGVGDEKEHARDRAEAV
jgi:hypothetical protein